MTCKHENADHLKAGDFWDNNEVACFGPYEAKCEQLRCLDCGAWLSLGPANDDDERVGVEIRAAEIAAERSWPNTCAVVDDDADCEECGWHEYIVDYCPPDARAGYHAGHLAACISTHDYRRATHEEP